VLEHKIYVYNFADLKLVDHIETTSNPKGLCALCPFSSNTVLVCPGLAHGHVRVELYDLKKTTLIKAHETALSCFALNLDGTLLATTSEKGTLIRVFDTATGEPVQELRRGVDKAEIYSLCFSSDSKWLACSSDKGTIHIFALKTGKEEEKSDSDDSEKDKKKKKKNPKSSLSFMKGLLPKYFSSEWSFAQYRVPDVRTIVAFGHEKNSIIVVSADGTFYKAIFDPEKGGECVQESYKQFIGGTDD